ncbi:MAG: hypothetical protein ACYCW6_26645 [Candidatus Xenobia bacterium]
MTPAGQPRIAFDPALSFEQRFYRLMEAPDPHPPDPRFATGLSGVRGDILAWALCVLAVHLGDAPWRTLDDVRRGLPHLPQPLQIILEKALDGTWPGMEEPLALLDEPPDAGAPRPPSRPSAQATLHCTRCSTPPWLAARNFVNRSSLSTENSVD